MTDIEKKRFHNNGINGNNHELEKKLKTIEDNNQIKKLEPTCLVGHVFHNLYDFRMQIDCVNCKSLLVCTNNENRHCGECLLFNLEVPGNCREPGYGTKANNNACDRFKLNINR